MDEIYQRFEQADPAQALVCLEDAFAHGAQSLPFYLEALYHDAIAVRAKAYAQLQSLAGGEGRSPNQLQQWLQTLQDIIDPDEVQIALKRGIPLFSGDVIYKVYVSAIDYDDEYYSLLDSAVAILTHDFQYSDGSEKDLSLSLIAVCLSADHAQQIADDFHQTALANKPYQEFTQKHAVLLKESPFHGSAYIVDFAEYYRNWEQPIRNWCVENSVKLDPEFESEDYTDPEFASDYFEEQEWIIHHLTDTKDYQRLSKFCEFVGMGKFAFVDETLVLREVEFFKP